MSYVQRVLRPDETVLGMTRIHWLIYLPAILFLLLAIAALAAGAVAALPDDQHIVAEFGAGALAVIALLLAFRAWLRRLATELAVTNYRVIYKTGLIGRRTIEMTRNKVESVDVEQSMMGRLFGYGTIIVRGTGGSLEPIRDVSNPLDFRSHIIAS